ncbi:hypothetical protein [Actinoplanes sp. URMC 104]|uniref:hypothetical protein n=1 Tax=Actinoplanes sp. URMC 104 TaxID=3423409 RepID=UPI003F19BA06
MPISFEISGDDRCDAPPFADGCPQCAFAGVVIPFATFTEGDTLHAFYEHGRCGNQWHTAWGARYSTTWQRVVGDRPALAA